jgi:hypothetical protein
MLAKMRDGAWRWRWGAVALAISVPLAIPATASANNIPGAYTRTYINNASAFSWSLRPTDYALNFQLRQTYASRINSYEWARAANIDCQGCVAVAVAIQVVVVSKQNLVAVTQYTKAKATNRDCIECTAVADAYQIVYATDSQPLLTDGQKNCLEGVKEDLKVLRNSGDSGAQLQTQVGDLVTEIVSYLQDSSSSCPASAPDYRTPADDGPSYPTVNGSDLQDTWYSDARPVVDLYQDVQY